MRKSFYVCVAFVASMNSQAKSENYFGKYVSVESVFSEMSIKHGNNGVIIHLKGGGNPSDGAAVSADCEAFAKGEIQNGKFRGNLIPFSSDLFEISDVDVKKMNSLITIEFNKNYAEVKGEFSHCGLRNSLGGKYKKRNN